MIFTAHPNPFDSYMFLPKKFTQRMKNRFTLILSYYIFHFSNTCDIFFNPPPWMSKICQRFWFFVQNHNSKMAEINKVSYLFVPELLYYIVQFCRNFIFLSKSHRSSVIIFYPFLIHVDDLFLFLFRKRQKYVKYSDFWFKIATIWWLKIPKSYFFVPELL